MAWYDSKTGKIIKASPRRYGSYLDWIEIDCGCCGGLEWGGEYPRECNTCKGGGALVIHIPSKRLALYPGGPFCGLASEDDLHAVTEKKAGIHQND